ncbi:MAG: phytoene/squalene synthase family protein [Candidatus Neomarinimicrobiota bacterium]|nr:phytoene/squalene synthase family protein [Candidatus Neomarinimicrobiota bacterium]MED5433235.1 phytoene/squalene synthase family protein [Candidatus Neomarinimicrobiota bacterium]
MSNIERYLHASYQSSKAVTKSFSTSFTLGIYSLSKKLRKPIYGIYGFVRIADEIVDTFFNTDQATVLDEFESATYSAIDTKYSPNLILHSFQEVVNQYEIDRELIIAFFSSMRSDLTEKEHSQKSLDQYVYGSAEAVGLMCLKIFVEGNQEAYDKLEYSAKKLGSAFQKVNFFRDIHEDYFDKGRTYFPAFDIDQNLNEEVKKLIESEIASEFSEAKKGIYQLPSTSRFGVLLACRYYEKLFSKLQSTPAKRLSTRRIRINNFQKMLLIPSTYALSLLRGFNR